MNDTMVSIRMPKELVDSLRGLMKKENFLDLSECIRSVTRQRWSQHAEPEIFEIKKLRESIEEEIREKSLKKIQQEVAKELDQIKSSLKKEGFSNG